MKVPDGLPDRIPSTVVWERAPRVVYATFKNVGDSAVGYVHRFDLEKGETLYKKDTPCGYLDLWAPPDRLVRVRLDSGPKTDRVAEAELKRGMLVRFVFAVSKDTQSGATYKDYEVEVGVVPEGGG